MNEVRSFLIRLHDSVALEEAQDLVEYALVVALIAFGALSTMKFLAGGINTAFSEIASVITSNIS